MKSPPPLAADLPRLSETLSGPRSPYHCQACGALSSRGLEHWQEHDANDKPEPIAVVLCPECSGKLIEPHPRLYRRLERNEPFPGVMRICHDCPARDGIRCTSPLSLANGGPGLKFPATDTVMFWHGTDKRGRRTGGSARGWSKAVEACEGKVPGTMGGDS